MKDKVCIRRRKPCTLRDLCRSYMCACTHIGLCFYVIVPIKIMGSKGNYKTVSKCDRVSASLQSPPPPSRAILSLAHIQPHNRRLRPRRGIQKCSTAGSAHAHLIRIVLCHCCYIFSIASLLHEECMLNPFSTALHK